MTEAWFHERTREGWEVRDENRLIIALVPDVEHKREADAELIATAPFGHARLRDAFGLLIGNLEDEIMALRTKITSLVRSVVDDATALAQRAQASGPDNADPTWVSMRVRELSETRTELHEKLARLRELRNVIEFGEEAAGDQKTRT